MPAGRVIRFICMVHIKIWLSALWPPLEIGNCRLTNCVCTGGIKNKHKSAYRNWDQIVNV